MPSSADRPLPPPEIGPAAPRRPYAPPALEALGRWSARTLQQSIPIGPGGIFDGIEWPTADVPLPSEAGREFLDLLLLPAEEGMPWP